MIFKKNQFSNAVASLGSAKEFLFSSGYAEGNDVNFLYFRNSYMEMISMELSLLSIFSNTEKIYKSYLPGNFIKNNYLLFPKIKLYICTISYIY